MSCCLGFSASKQLVEDIVKTYHPDDYKIITPERGNVVGITYQSVLMVVVKPDVKKNNIMFEDFVKLSMKSDSCVKILDSRVNWKDDKLVDIFVFKIESEVL